jgi:hypothetical protein
MALEERNDNYDDRQHSNLAERRPEIENKRRQQQQEHVRSN